MNTTIKYYCFDCLYEKEGSIGFDVKPISGLCEDCGINNDVHKTYIIIEDE